MKLSLTYETQVTVIVNLDTETVESITVRKELGSPLSGVSGPISIAPIHTPGDYGPFTRDQQKRAIEILKTEKHPKWTLKTDREREGL